MHKEEDSEILSCMQTNRITDGKVKILPCLVQQYGVVELVLLNGPVRIESEYAPIRYGRYCGSRVILNQGIYETMIDLNPKFIWNDKEWLLSTFGPVLFLEMEINEPIRKENDKD